jgi:hypothetical protein
MKLAISAFMFLLLAAGGSDQENGESGYQGLHV